VRMSEKLVVGDLSEFLTRTLSVLCAGAFFSDNGVQSIARKSRTAHCADSVAPARAEQAPPKERMPQVRDLVA
jgi:hypothetical protein